MTSMIVRTLGAVAALGLAATSATGEWATTGMGEVASGSDYANVMAAADRDGSMMIVYFWDGADPQCRRFDDEVVPVLVARTYLAGKHCLRLALDTEIVSGGKAIRLLEHPAFAGLNRGPGLVVLDFSSKIESERGRVVCALALRADRPVEADDLAFLGRQGETTTIAWLTDYAEAMAKARQEQRMLLIYFQQSDGKGGCAQFESGTLSSDPIRQGLAGYVCLKLALDAKVKSEGRQFVLLRHASFSEMVGLPGIAIVDFSRPRTSYYGQVVSTFPFLHGKAYDTRQMGVILHLPPGKLTQRTLIYAVRTHPDAPQSTSGELNEYLLAEAESHSAYQARIRLQGHHAWDSRFQRINGRLPGGLLAKEVCAESWPGQNLLEAALDCVQCWRQSSGHWKAVRSTQPVFGYDMRRGLNGIWYATGIFGGRGQ